MISKKVFSADGTTTRFLSDFLIRSEQFARPYVYIYDEALAGDGSEDVLQDGTTLQSNWSYPDNLWRRGVDSAASNDLTTTDKWQVVDNSILYYIAPLSGTRVWVEVATTAEEFGDTLTQPSYQNIKEAEWEGTAAKMTADSYATQPEDEFVIEYTSNKDGTYTGTPTTEYSALHWANKSEESAVTVEDKLHTVDTISDMLLLDAARYPNVNVLGYTSVSDGGGGLFNYIEAQSSTNNGGTILDGWVRQHNGVVNARWFGATGDGITDDAISINKLIDYINDNEGTKVKFQKGTYLIGAALTGITSEVFIDGMGSTIKFDVDTKLSFGNPSYLTYPLSSDCSEYYFEVINRDTLGIEVGDIFTITCDTLWRHDNRGTLTYGELSKVAYLPTSNSNVLISLQGSAPTVIGEFLEYTEYTTVNNAKATFYHSKGMTLENLTIDGNGTAVRSLSITGYDNPTVRNVRFNSFLDTNAGISKSYAPLVDSCHINTNYINYTTSGTGYGFQFSGCTGAKFVNGSAHNVRRGVDFSGDYPSLGGGVYNSHFSNCSSSAFGSHGTAVGTVYDGNTATNVYYLALLRGENEIVSNNSVNECSAIVSHSYGWGHTTINNKAIKSGAVVRVSDTALDEKTQDLYTDAYIDTISGNIVKNASYGLVRFDVTATNKKINGFVIRDNYIGRITGGSASNAMTSATSGTDLTGMTFGKTCVIIGNQVGSEGSYSGFFDRNVTIEQDAVVNGCWHDNVATSAITANGFGGAGTATIGTLGHNYISMRRGQIKGQISVSVTVSGGGVNQIQLNSDIFYNPYATSPASGSLIVTDVTGLCLGKLATAGLVTIYRNVDGSGTFSDGTYTFFIALDIHNSTSRTVMSNI